MTNKSNLEASITNMLESETFKKLVANWRLQNISAKNADETRLAIAHCGARMLSALDENRITFHNQVDREQFHLILALLLREPIELALNHPDVKINLVTTDNYH